LAALQHWIPKPSMVPLCIYMAELIQSVIALAMTCMVWAGRGQLLDLAGKTVLLHAYPT
jgi:hypothetical protein